jgi:large subunit ribosomal protein L9
VVSVKTGEDGKMFGSVTAGTIADQLKTQFEVALDKRKIHLEHPIRTLGEHEVELRLHADVITKLKVRVESSNPLPPPEEAKAGERPGDRTEKRGRRFERTENAPAAEKTDKPEKAEKAEKTEKAEKPAKVEKTEKKSRAPKPEKTEKA